MRQRASRASGESNGNQVAEIRERTPLLPRDCRRPDVDHPSSDLNSRRFPPHYRPNGAERAILDSNQLIYVCVRTCCEPTRLARTGSELRDGPQDVHQCEHTNGDHCRIRLCVPNTCKGHRRWFPAYASYCSVPLQRRLLLGTSASSANRLHCYRAVEVKTVKGQ